MAREKCARSADPAAAGPGQGGKVYAGFELELAGAERYREWETRDDTESAATRVLT
jgi:hypothetical protein